MLRLLTPLVFILLLAACGSTSEVGTGSGDAADDTVPAELLLADSEPEGEEAPDVVSSDDPDTVVSDEVDDAEPEQDPLPVPSSNIDLNDAQVIPNGASVDPRIISPGELLLNPDDDSELWVRFVGGDPNCTAASAALITETPEVVEIELMVGITEDALARSCVAGDFALQVNVALNESAAGKTLEFVRAPQPGPAQITPDLTVDDFVGLTEDEATSIVEENLLTARTVRVDDEFFPVTEDFRPERLNFEVDDGIITSVGLG